jgi:hypothetical protein
MSADSWDSTQTTDPYLSIECCQGAQGWASGPQIFSLLHIDAACIFLAAPTPSAIDSQSHA